MGQINRSIPDQKMSVSSHYYGVCCPFHEDGYRHGNKKRGGHNKCQNETLADKRRKAKKAEQAVRYEANR